MGTNSTKSSIMDQVVVMYMAQIPYGDVPPQKWYPIDGDTVPYVPPNANPTVTPTGTTWTYTAGYDVQKVTELLEAILDLKTANGEVYALKALAWLLKYGEETEAK